MPQEIQVVDSHTAGEPTRVVLAGGPELGDGPLDARLERFRDSFDHYRAAIVREPRGSDVLVGALLCRPADQSCQAGVIFFNNVGYLGMCGHGMIGLIATLGHLGKINPGRCRVETPVGVVTADLHEDGSVSIENVSSYRAVKGFAVQVPEVGNVIGDIAWGGNWFFLVREPNQEISIQHVGHLQTAAAKIRAAVNQSGHPEVDHIELFGDAENGDSRNFVLCPGLQYDRSPCGTGTSAKLACLAADGKLSPGQVWVQEGILGSSFRGSFQWDDESEKTIIPTITGSAYVTAQATLILQEDDPFRWGI